MYRTSDTSARAGHSREDGSHPMYHGDDTFDGGCHPTDRGLEQMYRGGDTSDGGIRPSNDRQNFLYRSADTKCYAFDTGRVGFAAAFCCCNFAYPTLSTTDPGLSHPSAGQR